MMVTKTSCAGAKQIDHRFPRATVLVKFEVKGKSRWPFGWDILRELGAAAPFRQALGSS